MYSLILLYHHVYYQYSCVYMTIYMKLTLHNGCMVFPNTFLYGITSPGLGLLAIHPPWNPSCYPATSDPFPPCSLPFAADPDRTNRCTSPRAFPQP